MNRILVVEDDPAIAEMLAFFLKSRGYEADVAYTLEQGLKKPLGGYRAILLDIMLEGKESFPILEKAKSENPQVKVVMISGYGDDENVEKARAMGANGFIAKPFTGSFLEEFLLCKIEGNPDRA